MGKHLLALIIEFCICLLVLLLIEYRHRLNSWIKWVFIKTAVTFFLGAVVKLPKDNSTLISFLFIYDIGTILTKFFGTMS